MGPSVRPLERFKATRRDTTRHEPGVYPGTCTRKRPALQLPPFRLLRHPGTRRPIEFHAHATPLHRRNQVLALFFSIRPISHTVYTIKCWPTRLQFARAANCVTNVNNTSARILEPREGWNEEAIDLESVSILSDRCVVRWCQRFTCELKGLLVIYSLLFLCNCV